MTTQPIHLPRPRPVFGGAPASRRVASRAAVVMPTGRASAAEHGEVLRQRIAVTTLALAFIIGAGAIGFATGWLPGM